MATNHLFGPGVLEEQGHYHADGDVEEQYELMQKGYVQTGGAYEPPIPVY